MEGKNGRNKVVFIVKYKKKHAWLSFCECCSVYAEIAIYLIDKLSIIITVKSYEDENKILYALDKLKPFLTLFTVTEHPEN